MLKRSHYLALGAVFALALGALSLPDRLASKAKVAVGSLFLPLFGLAGSVQAVVERTGSNLQSRRSLVDRVRVLEAENQRLQIAGHQVEELQRENAELRRLLSWQRQAPWKSRLARVVGRDPANWWRTIQIDLGGRDGVRTNLPVMTPEGLVGRVAEVGYDRSQVVLVGDPNCRVAAWIHETRDQGIISPGLSALDPQLVHLTYLPNNDNIRPGQWVATSGLGAFPGGIPVGKVLDTRKIGYGMYTEARVKLAAPLGRLREVWVIWP